MPGPLAWRAFSRRPAHVPLWVSFQPAVWAREPEKFLSALEHDRPPGRVDRVTQLPPSGGNPHEAILPVALESALVELFGVQPAG